MEVAAQATTSAGNRVVAFLIDVLVMLVVSALLQTPGVVLAVIYLLSRDGIPFLDGQSIGKKVLDLQAVDYKGDPLTNNWRPVVLRNVFLLVFPFFPTIELLVLLSHTDGRRIGDQIANTRVVNIYTNQPQI
jgi:uncharacterized RDD family membrane protein YckC